MQGASRPPRPPQHPKLNRKNANRKQPGTSWGGRLGKTGDAEGKARRDGSPSPRETPSSDKNQSTSPTQGLARGPAGDGGEGRAEAGD